MKYQTIIKRIEESLYPLAHEGDYNMLIKFFNEKEYETMNHILLHSWKILKEYKIITSSFKQWQQKLQTNVGQSYYDNGFLSFMCLYLDGKLHGSSYSYNIQGFLHNITNYVRGKKHGPNTYYYDSGKVYIQEHYDYGKEHGQHIEYHENGRIAKEYNVFNGRITGALKVFSESGFLLKLEMYRSGRLNGESIRYFENGKLYHRLFYKKGIQVGEYRAYYPSGNPKIFYCNNKNGLKDGPFIKWYDTSDNKIEVEVDYINGNKEGYHNSYYINGNLNKVSYFVNDIITNEVISYYENGEIYSKKIYENGELKTKTYYQNNKVKLNVNYKNGYFVSKKKFKV